MDKLIETLMAAKPVMDAEAFLKSKDLYGEGVLDSFDILVIVEELCEAYGIEMDITSFSREDFMTVESIRELVRRRGGQA
ncbi:MAG: phosphopantetheine-binding protein [Peptococcaceae bacterium]|jgi:acyl carrier protein|nr:phosphopantetheine-binding protein [Peptococcaceae bacterium]